MSRFNSQFDQQQREHCFRNRSLQGIEQARSSIEDEALAEETIKKHEDRHQWRPTTQPIPKALGPRRDSVQFKAHVATLRRQPRRRALPIVMNEAFMQDADRIVDNAPLLLPVVSQHLAAREIAMRRSLKRNLMKRQTPKQTEKRMG
ncbi:MAG: hypothetical protein ACTHJS_17500 [Xanthobacteraceae bacterium]